MEKKRHAAKMKEVRRRKGIHRWTHRLAGFYARFTNGFGEYRLLCFQSLFTDIFSSRIRISPGNPFTDDFCLVGGHLVFVQTWR